MDEFAINLSSFSPSGADLLPVFVLGGVLVAFLLVGLVFLARTMHQQSHRRRGGSLSHVVLSIRVPRFFAQKAEIQQVKELRSVQEDIGVAETFFAALGGLSRQKGLGAWWHGRTDHAALEIVSSGGVLSFYAAVPPSVKDFFVQQLHAQYPNSEIAEVDDYNIFTPKGSVLASALTLKSDSILPLKTYRQLEGDSLLALLNAFSKVPSTDGAVLQILLRPSSGSGRRRGRKFAEAMQAGATMKQALKGKKPSKKDKDGSPKEARRLSSREEEMVKAVEEKLSRAVLEANMRVVTSSASVASAQASLNNILNSFAQYNVYEFGNSFEKASVSPRRAVPDFIFRHFSNRHTMELSTEEWASIWHLPLPGTDVSNLDWLEARRGAAPANIAHEGLLLGTNEFRGQATKAYMKHDDRRRHMYIIGKSGSGKTEFIANLAQQDILAGRGVCVVDPHGDLVDTLLGSIPPERVNDVIVFSPYDRDYPVGLNMLEAPTPELKDFAVQEMISIFYKLFPPEMIGPMFEHNMRNVMLTLMSDENEPGTIAEIPRMFSDEAYQKKWILKVKDPVVRAFWEQEMAKTSDFHKSEMLGYLISKVGRFVEDEMMRNIIGQARSGFNLREVMDQKKILFMDLSKGKTGEVNSQLLGLIVVTKLQMAALARADMPEDQRSDFYLYIDEFQNFVTPSIATILSEARKYRLDLILAHQYMSQVVEKGDTQIRDAILGNVGSLFVSRIGPEDVETFEKIFEPTFSGNDLMNSEKFTWYVKMIVDNSQVVPFTLKGSPPLKRDLERAAKIRQLSRLTYGRPRREVEAEIQERAKIGTAAVPRVYTEPKAG